MGPPAVRRLTYDEYLAIERTSGVKHEYADGDVWAMAGGTPTHADLGGRMYAALSGALEGRSCRPYNSDLKIRIPELDRAYYPDVSVICGPLVRDRTDRNAVTNPTVLVEVLSDSTEVFDRGGKFADYESLASLREYVLVSADQPRIEVYARNPDGSWLYRHLGRGDTLRLVAIDVAVPVDRIYDGVELDPPRQGPGLVTR